MKSALVAAVFCAGGTGAVAEVVGSIRVIDADTFEVSDTRVRLYGIDAPELAQTCTSKSGALWECGAWATANVRKSYQNRFARCEALDIDRYQRIVARCFVAGEDVGQALVRHGWAFAYRKYSTDYIGAEREAAQSGTGLHAGTFEAPSVYRSALRSTEPVSDAGCKIKGNISSKGARIYHRPGQRDYARTRISRAKGERWFCSTDAAEKAGWRAARR